MELNRQKVNASFSCSLLNIQKRVAFITVRYLFYLVIFADTHVHGETKGKQPYDNDSGYHSDCAYIFYRDDHRPSPTA